MQVKLLTVCQISFKFGLVKHILNKNTLHNGQEVVFMLETIFFKYSLAIEYANTKEQEFAGHAIFSCLSKSYDILNSTSEFTFFGSYFRRHLTVFSINVLC